MMPIAKFKMPDGRIAKFKVPEGLTLEQVQKIGQDFALKQGGQDSDYPEVPQSVGLDAASPQRRRPAQPQGELAEDEFSSFGREALSGLELSGVALSSAIAEPIAGVAGGLAALNPFASKGAGARVVDATREALTLDARMPESRRALGGAGGTAAVQGLSEAIQDAEEFTGNIGESVGGVVGAPGVGFALGSAAPTAIAELFGLKGIRRVKSEPTEKAIESEASRAEIVSGGDRAGIPTLTTDIFPPDTAIGKMTQAFGEKIPVVGTGANRAKQQIARQDAVIELANEFGIDESSDFAPDIMRSLKAENKKKLARAAQVRGEAVDALDEFGEVPTPRAVEEINAQIERLKSIERGTDKQGIISALTDTRDKIESLENFSLARDVRSDLIADIKAIERAEDTRNLTALSPIKKALDKDLVAFGRSNNPAAAKKWLASNRAFAETLDVSKRSALKKLIAGDAPPENVMSIIRSNKPSQLKVLANSLTPKGRLKVQSAIIQDALKSSGIANGDVNPDKLATELGKPRTVAAINEFFDGAGKAQLVGLRRVLDATRRAQGAAVSTPTGMQNAFAGGAGLTGAALAGVPGAQAALASAASFGGLTRIYESSPVRKILTRLGRAKEGTKLEIDLLNQLPLAFIAANNSLQNQEEAK